MSIRYNSLSVCVFLCFNLRFFAFFMNTEKIPIPCSRIYEVAKWNSISSLNISQTCNIHDALHRVVSNICRNFSKIKPFRRAIPSRSKGKKFIICLRSVPSGEFPLHRHNVSIKATPSTAGDEFWRREKCSRTEKLAKDEDCLESASCSPARYGIFFCVLWWKFRACIRWLPLRSALLMKSTTVLVGNKSDSRKSEWQLNSLESGADEEEELKFSQRHKVFRQDFNKFASFNYFPSF